MQNLKDEIQNIVRDNISDVIKLRRYLHAHPELSFEEINTSKFICDYLDDIEVNYSKGIAGTGVVAILRGKSVKGGIIALRADMDALPIKENTGLEYESVNTGVMHACGHDAHTASLLGVAKVLKKMSDKWSGTVYLIFQPGEELLPGGAKLMLEENIFTEGEPSVIIGQHVLPEMEVGKIGFCPGRYMASCDEIYIKVKGNGGHAAMPQRLTDTVLIASNIVVALQQVVSRRADTRIPTVLSVGRIEGLGATNVIPSEVNMQGTFRTMDEEWRTEAHKHIVDICEGISKSMGAECVVDIKKGYPALINDELLTDKLMNLSKDFLGDDSVVLMEQRMTAEDFSYFSQRYPSVFYRFGVGSKRVGMNNKLHSPEFVIDESALETSVSNMAWLTIKLLIDTKKI
jgi:amidohydrolase